MPQENHAEADNGEKPHKNKETPKAGLWAIGVGGVVAAVAVVGVGFLFIKEAERVAFITVNLLSLSVLIAIIVQARIYKKQWDAMLGQLGAMRDSVTQNERAVKAAEKSAQLAEANRIDAAEQWHVQERAMIEQSGALTAQANAYVEMVSQNERLVRSAEIQAEAAREQAGIVLRQFEVVARPYVSIKNASLARPLTAGVKLEIKAVFINTGHMGAHVRLWDASVFCRTAPPPDRLRYYSSPEQKFDVAPGGVETHASLLFNFTLTQEQIDAVKKNETESVKPNDGARLYFYMRGEYHSDAGTTYPFNFCAIYFRGGLAQCHSDLTIE